MGLINDALSRQDRRAAALKPIDYDRMKKVYPQQKAELTRVAKTGDPERIAAVVKKHIVVWNEIGCWPDNWAHWQITLNDALPWNQFIEIENL
jgi:hypothetical protein